jgi:TonB family protein
MLFGVRAGLRWPSLCAAWILIAIGLPFLSRAQDIPGGRIVRVVPEAILENLRRDRWNGEPSGGALSHRVLDEGVLELTKDKGWLYTARNYYDFRLEYETRVGERGRHRVFFRTLNWPAQSYELRFERKDGALAGQLLATRWNLRKANLRIRNDVLRPVTEGREWHHVEIRCEGTRAVVLVNGHEALVIGGLDALGGTIGFAGDGVAYRSARLTAAPAGPAIFTTAYVPDVEESIQMPKVLREVRPQMPAAAYKNPRNYIVVVEAVIDEDGNVAAARFLRRLDEDAGYNAEAMRAVHQWKFTPARLNGKAVPILVTIELSFKWE